MTSAPARPALWREEIDQPLVCVGVRQETHDVASFTLRADEPTMLRFDPGQYLTVTAEIDGAASEPLLHHRVGSHTT